MKVLLAEDEMVSGRLLESLLQKWGYDVLFVTDGKAAWNELQQYDHPHLALLDWMMPEMDGIEVCKRLRAQKRQTYTYTILLTVKSEKEDIVKGLESGADDYITKPFHREELRWRLRIGERILDLENRLQRKLLKTASSDTLTGVMHRRAFTERMIAELSRARRQGVPISIILVDIDHFSNINDQYGYLSGDLVLQEVADCLRKLCRTHDLLARYGSDEFILCCPELDSLHAQFLADGMKEAIESLRISVPSSLIPITVSVRFGITASTPHSQEPVDALILRVEEALFQAKKQQQGVTNTIL